MSEHLDPTTTAEFTRLTWGIDAYSEPTATAYKTHVENRFPSKKITDDFKQALLPDVIRHNLKRDYPDPDNMIRLLGTYEAAHMPAHNDTEAQAAQAERIVGYEGFLRTMYEDAYDADQLQNTLTLAQRLGVEHQA